MTEPTKIAVGVTRQYPSLFSAAYWRAAARDLRDIRRFAVAAMLAAISVALESFNLPITASIQIHFTFLPGGLCGMICGPWLSLVYGIITDVVACVIAGYAFFPGYTLSAALSSLIYALFLYRRPLSFPRLLGCRGVINLFINTLLGSVWRVMFYGKSPYLVYVGGAALKNCLLLPIETLMMAWVYAALAPALVRLGLRERGDTPRRPARRDILLAVLASILIAALAVGGVFWFRHIGWIK